MAALLAVSAVPAAWAACAAGVAIDAISTNTAAANTNTITISHTTSGTDRLMLVFPQWNAGNNVPQTVTGVTYGGISLTRVGGANDVDDAAVDIWRLVAPPTGTANVVITYSANLVYNHIAGVVTFTGVDQTTPLGAFSGAAGTASSASVNVSSATGELVVGTVCTETITTLTPGGGQTTLWDISVGSSNRTHCAASTKAGAATVTMSYTFSSSDHYALGGVSIKPTAGPPPPPPFTPCNWQRRRKLTFNNSAQAENLMNFPVLVVLNSSRIDYSNTQSAGQDLRFTDSDGVTVLAHEIESWTSGGTSYVWVKVPQIDASSTTDHIWMYYGNASVADGQDRTAVWSNGFQAVWHLHNDFTDSTCNANNGTNFGTVSSTGVAANGRNFNGTSHYINTNFISNYGANQNFTWEGWFNVNNINGSDDILGIEDRGAGDLSEIRLSVRTSLSGNNPVNMYNTWIRPDTGTSYNGDVSISPASGQWHHAVLLRNGGTARLYLDGSEVNNAPVSTNALNFPVTLLIGAQWQTDSSGQRNFFAGDMDEVRTSTTARSAAWIAATHKTIKDTFITFAAEETPGISVSYFSPDAAAAGMHIPVTFVGSFCSAPNVTTNSSDIIVGPSILTDGTGAVVTQNGTALTTMFFVKPNARPKTGITVNVGGQAFSQTFDLVMPAPDPNVPASGSKTLSQRTKRGTNVLGRLTVGAGGTLTIDKGDTDGGTTGNQGYLPTVILVKGAVSIAGTLDVKGQDGTNGGANCTGGTGGTGGPGGGGGGGGGVRDGSCSGGGASLDVRVAASTDDAEESSSGSMDLVSTGFDIGEVPHLGMRFQNITIPQGTTITNAYVEFVAEQNDSVATNSTYYGEAIDNAPTFTSSSFNISSRTKTSASAAWNNMAAWTANQTYQTPNLATIIQEIVNRPGWASGNSLVILITATGDRDARTFNAGSGVAPLLHVDYGTAGSSTAAAGGAGFSGGGGGGSKGSGVGGAGGDGSGAAGNTTSGVIGGDGGTALGGATGGGGASGTENAGGGGTGNPFGTGGGGGVGTNQGGAAGKGGGGGGVGSSTAAGGAGGGFATAGVTPPDGDAGQGGLVNSNAQLAPLSGGSGGAGGGPDFQGPAGHRGGGGGGGGGAILLYSTRSIDITGTLTAAGGKGGNGYISGSEPGGAGGGGSGGAVLLQSSKVTVGGTLTTAAGAAGSSSGNAVGGAGGTGRIRIDGLSAGATVPGTAGSKYIGPVIDTLVDKTVKGRANGGATVTLYVYDETGAQVSGSPYTTTASSSSGTVGTWTINNVTFPSGTAYLAVKQSSGSVAVFGPGRASKGLHLTNWREVY